MKLEVRIPISPGESWFNKVRLAAESIREFEPDTLINVSVGADADYLSEGTPYFERWGASFHLLPRAEFLAWHGTRWPWLATMMDRYKPPFDGDYILMMDADVVCLRDFSELFEHDGISGMMAHVPPVSVMDWARLMERFGVQSFSLDREYSGWGTMVTDPASHFGPVYFNSGVVFGPRAVFEKLYEPYFEAIQFLRAHLADTYFFDQIGLALGIAKAGIPANVLPHRYNFPNQAEFDRAHPRELANITFLHYMRTNIIDRDRDMMDRSAMEKLIARQDLAGSNEIFRQRLEQLLPRIA